MVPVTMYSEKKYGILLVLIAGEIAIGLALPRISGISSKFKIFLAYKK